MTTAKRRASNSATNCSNEHQQLQQHSHDYVASQNQQHHYQHHHSNQQQYSQYQQSYQATHYQQNQQQSQHSSQQHRQQQHHNRDCSVKLPLDILWLPKSAMRPVGPETSHSDCILVVGVSRPKLAVVFLTVMLISLFLTFHVLYDSAVYNIQAAQVVSEHHRRLSMVNRQRNALLPDLGKSAATVGGKLSSSSGSSATAAISGISAANQISHPMVFPSNRVHFPKTSRRLPQALIIGIRKCGTRALLEMLYLHPSIQKAGGEVHFFDRDENYNRGLDWYRKKMPHSFRGQITIEKSPSYFVSPEVPERVRAMNASIKLLLIVREPVTRAISDYTQLRSHAATATLPLAENAERAAGAAALSSLEITSTNVGGASTSGNAGSGNGIGIQQLKTQQSLLYGKLSGYSSAQLYDNSIGGGDSGAVAAGLSVGKETYKSKQQQLQQHLTHSNNAYRLNNNEIHTTQPTPAAVASVQAAAAAQQLAAKSFEELAIFPNGTVNESYRPLTISMYHLHLNRWLEVFPREQLLVVNGDRLIEDPVSQLKRIETFLGIEHRVTNSHFYFNETKGFYCLRYDNGDRCLRETKGRKHPHVDPGVISKLRKFFAEHNQRFYELVGEDLGWPEE